MVSPLAAAEAPGDSITHVQNLEAFVWQAVAQMPSTRD